MIKQFARLRVPYLSEIAMTVAGLVLVASPLALWASPSTDAYYAVLLTCAAAYGVVVLVAKLDPNGRSGRAHLGRQDGRSALPDHLIGQVQNRRERSRREIRALTAFVRKSLDPPKRSDN